MVINAECSQQSVERPFMLSFEFIDFSVRTTEGMLELKTLSESI